jgi:hypothetical protein
VCGGGGDDLGGRRGDVAGVDQVGAALAGGGAEAARPASISACQRRRAIGESAGALLVALTTWPAPALAALATTLSSWAGTAGLTSTTPLTPLIASSMLAGTPRSPVAISAPASASVLAVAFAGSRTSTRTGTSRSRSRRAVSEPTFPAVVIGQRARGARSAGCG